MANVLSLALKINADASGLKLDPVEKALQRLGTEVDKVTASFAPFATETAAAAEAQAAFASRFNELAQQLQDNTITAQQYADSFATLRQEVTATAAVFAEGAKTTAQYELEADKVAAQVARLDEQLRAGAISQETYQRAIADVTGENQKAAAAEAEREKFLQRAAQLTQNVVTPMQAYDAAVQELNTHLAAGTITQDVYDRNLAEVTANFVKAESAAQGYDKAVEGAGKGGTLAFNELSGILAVLPGPLGDLAGRFSGIASAGEGLGRVFSGGLSGGFQAVAASVTSMINPLTLGLAAVTALGAAASAVVAGLSELDSVVEKLANTASKLGVSFGFIQVLEEAATRSGTSLDAVSAAFGRLQKSVTGVDEESKAAQAALASIGVTAEELKTLAPEEQYRLIGEGLSAIEDPAKRSATAVQLFGKTGADLLPFFNSIDPAATDLERFNGALSDVDGSRIEQLGDSFDAVRISLQGLGREALTPFIGITQSISDGLASAFAAAGRNIGALLDALSPVTSAIGLVANVFLQAGAIIDNFVGTALEPSAAAGRILSGVIDSISQAVTAVAGRINDAITGFREFFKFESVAESFGDAFSGVSDAFESIGEIAGRISTIVVAAVQAIGSAISETFGRVASLIGEAAASFGEFTGISATISAVASTISSAFQSLWSNITAIISGIGGFIEQVLTFAEDWLGIKTTIEEPITPQINTEQLDEAEAVSKEFQKTLDDVGVRLNKAIEESAQFGQAGFDAAFQYQEALKEIQRQFDAGIINEAAYKTAIDNATESYEGQIDAIKRTQDEATKRAEAERAAAQKIIDDNKRIADQLLEQLDIDQQFGGDSGRAKAAANVKALTEEIARVEAEIEAARQSGDAAAAAAGAARLARLDQARAREEDIASGAAAEREAAAKAQEEAAREQERIDEEQLRRLQQLAEQVQQANVAIFEAQQKYNDKLYEVEKERIEELNTLRGGAVSIADIRNGGAGIFLDLAGGREDPAIAEYRQQLKELKALRSDINKLVAQKAEILGGVG